MVVVVTGETCLCRGQEKTVTAVVAVEVKLAGVDCSLHSHAAGCCSLQGSGAYEGVKCMAVLSPQAKHTNDDEQPFSVKSRCRFIRERRHSCTCLVFR